MLHIALPSVENIQPRDLGAVSDFPIWNDADIELKFGITKAALLGCEFKISRADREKCRARVIRIGAVCDHAQNRPGALIFLLGLEIPVSVTRKTDPSGKLQTPLSEWSSPLLSIDGEPFTLNVNSRFTLSVSSAECKDWNCLYRLRADLTENLTSHATSYISRPGFTSFRTEPAVH